jgi:hypothetical protein
VVFLPDPLRSQPGFGMALALWKQKPQRSEIYETYQTFGFSGSNAHPVPACILRGEGPEGQTFLALNWTSLPQAMNFPAFPSTIFGRGIHQPSRR